MSDKMRNIPEKGKSTETPEQTIEKAQELLAQKKFDQLMALSRGDTINFSTREPDAQNLSIKGAHYLTDTEKSLAGYNKSFQKMIEYTKIIKPKTLQFSSRELKAQLFSNDNGKEYRYLSYIIPYPTYNGDKIEEAFPGIKNGKGAVVISTEKAIQIMDRMIQEIEAAKKCVPINKSKELLSELKEDVGEVEVKAA